MAMENLLDIEEVSRRELAGSDYQVIREVEKLLPRIKKLLDDGGVDTSDVDLAGVDSDKRDRARDRIRAKKVA